MSHFSARIFRLQLRRLPTTLMAPSEIVPGECRRRTSWAAIGLLLVLLTTGVVQAQPYWLVEDLGAVFPDYESSDGVRINELGAVIGWAYDRDSIAEPGFYWSESEGLHIIPAVRGLQSANVHGLNDLGEVVGAASEFVDGVQLYRPFLWTLAAGAREIEELESRVPFDINNNGVMTGITLRGPSFRFSERTRAIEFFDGQLEGINEANVAVGWQIDPFTHAGMAFRIEADGSVISLPEIAGYGVPQPYSINNRGQIVGRTFFPPIADTCCGYFFDPLAGARVIGTAAADFEALAINDLAHVVGFGSAAHGGYTAMVWSDEWGLIDLNTGHLASDGWYVEFLRDTNNADQMVGTGVRDGVRHAVRLIPWHVPEPGTAWLLSGFGVIAGLWWMMKRRRMLRQVVVR